MKEMKKMKGMKGMKEIMKRKAPSFSSFFSFLSFPSFLHYKRKGFGVHSPFVYNLITKVIEEKSAFYAFTEIETFRKELLARTDEASILTARETQPANYGAFLFRMVNFFKCRNVIQIGSSTGVMGLYLAMAAPTQCDCYLLDERQGILQSVREFALAHHLNRIHYMEGDCRENLASLRSTLPGADLIFINQLPETVRIETLMQWCEPLINKKSILILNDIVKNKKMKNFWRSVGNHPQVRVIMDLYALGIVFFDDKLPKRYYKAYFNHGKKQNLHKNRRRGIYFLSRRKKGVKNSSAH
jgi:predicted O-methyltransferase YrrM